MFLHFIQYCVIGLVAILFLLIISIVLLGTYLFLKVLIENPKKR